MKLEIKKLWVSSSGSRIPCSLSLWELLWWRFVPGVIVNVRWPTEHTADPNFHYRPYLEQYVGRQGRDWNWGLADRDATDNRLTIKIKQRHAKHATIMSMMWS